MAGGVNHSNWWSVTGLVISNRGKQNHKNRRILIIEYEWKNFKFAYIALSAKELNISLIDSTNKWIIFETQTRDMLSKVRMSLASKLAKAFSFFFMLKDIRPLSGIEISEGNS